MKTFKVFETDAEKIAFVVGAMACAMSLENKRAGRPQEFVEYFELIARDIVARMAAKQDIEMASAPFGKMIRDCFVVVSEEELKDGNRT